MTGESGGYPLCMIDMKDLWRSYRKQPALSGFSGEIELERGLIYGLIGPNGSGKTTLLKLLAGILVPSGGRIFRKGEGRKKENCAEQEASFPAWSQENVVYIPAGERGLRYKNTVRDNVLYFSALKGRSAEETEALLTRYASFLHCETLLDRRVETLSLGQKKKASLLCGLCAGARLILMDEPEGGLDLDARGIELGYFNYVDKDVVIIADAEQMKRVINNIIGNSIKYMDKKRGIINIRIQDVGDFIQVGIEDNGRGIAARDLPNIFDRFYRTDASRNSSKGGSGIGLSIVKKIIEDHGGRIWATSKEGIGTEIHFVLRKYQEVIQE